MAGRSPGWFEAVLIAAFGGPQGRADIRPFLERVLRGRRVTPERVEEVAHHYEIFGGVSPITRLTRLQAQGLEQRLSVAGYQLPVSSVCAIGIRCSWTRFERCTPPGSGALSVSSQRLTTPIPAVSSIARMWRTHGRSSGRKPAQTWTSRTSAVGSIIRSSSTSMRGTCVRPRIGCPPSSR